MKGRKETDTDIHLWLDRDEKAELEDIAKEQNLTLSQFIRLIINDYLQNHGYSIFLEMRQPGRPRKDRK